MFKVGRKMDLEFKNHNLKNFLLQKQPSNTQAKRLEQNY